MTFSWDLFEEIQTLMGNAQKHVLCFLTPSIGSPQADTHHHGEWVGVVQSKFSRPNLSLVTIITSILKHNICLPLKFLKYDTYYRIKWRVQNTACNIYKHLLQIFAMCCTFNETEWDIILILLLLCEVYQHSITVHCGSCNVERPCTPFATLSDLLWDFI
jgi:hypothetical protein